MVTTGITPELCAREVMETVPLVMRFIRAEMRRQGAPFPSVPQIRALTFLDLHPGASLSEVADHLGVTRPTASAIVDRLVRQDLVNRAGHPHERRRLALTLTATGSQLLQRAYEATRSRVARVLAGLSHEHLRKVEEGIALLGYAFKEEATPDVK